MKKRPIIHQNENTEGERKKKPLGTRTKQQLKK